MALVEGAYAPSESGATYRITKPARGRRRDKNLTPIAVAGPVVRGSGYSPVTVSGDRATVAPRPSIASGGHANTLDTVVYGLKNAFTGFVGGAASPAQTTPTGVAPVVPIPTTSTVTADGGAGVLDSLKALAGGVFAGMGSTGDGQVQVVRASSTTSARGGVNPLLIAGAAVAAAGVYYAVAK